MPTILDETDANLLVQHDNGRVEMISLSPMNKLLYDHDLWGLLREGDEILMIGATDTTPRVEVAPIEDEDNGYNLVVDDLEPLHLGPHHQSRLIDALMDYYESDTPEQLIRMFDSIRNKQIRPCIFESLATKAPFSQAVEHEDGGWLIYDHLLLTFEGKFHHPDTTSRRVSGSAVSNGSSQEAYKINVQSTTKDMDRTLTIDGQKFRLSDNEMEFFAKSIWALKNAPNNQ